MGFGLIFICLNMWYSAIPITYIELHNTYVGTFHVLLNVFTLCKLIHKHCGRMHNRCGCTFKAQVLRLEHNVNNGWCLAASL